MKSGFLLYLPHHHDQGQYKYGDKGGKSAWSDTGIVRGEQTRHHIKNAE